MFGKTKHAYLCPFHKEETPSMIVDHEKGTFHCCGCGVEGDAKVNLTITLAGVTKDGEVVMATGRPDEWAKK